MTDLEITRESAPYRKHWLVIRDGDRREWHFNIQLINWWNVDPSEIRGYIEFAMDDSKIVHLFYVTREMALRFQEYMQLYHTGGKE